MTRKAYAPEQIINKPEEVVSVKPAGIHGRSGGSAAAGAELRRASAPFSDPLFLRAVSGLFWSHIEFN